MDLNKITELLVAENARFRQVIRTAVDQTISKRNEMLSQLVEVLSLNSGREISAEEFFLFLKTFQRVSGGFEEVLQRSGFSDRAVSDWLNNKSAPPISSRKPVLQILVTAVLGSLIDEPLDELRLVFEEKGCKLSSKLPLDKKFQDLPIANELSSRTLHCIYNNGTLTLGEVLVLREQEWLMIPNFGRKSLRELKETLTKFFGVGLESLSGADCERYAQMTSARHALNSADGQLLPSRWDSPKLKPEYEKMEPARLWEKKRAGEEVCVQIEADPELVHTLEQAGIVYRTQLATAPLKVIDRICSGRANWRAQLLQMLEKNPGLKLGMAVPLFLNSSVAVYREEDS